jgi:hypothetical protein
VGGGDDDPLEARVAGPVEAVLEGDEGETLVELGVGVGSGAVEVAHDDVPVVGCALGVDVVEVVRALCTELSAMSVQKRTVITSCAAALVTLMMRGAGEAASEGRRRRVRRKWARQLMT